MNSLGAGTEFRYMGIDYGSKRIGIALCDPLLTFAYSYKTLINWQFCHKITRCVIQLMTSNLLLIRKRQ